MSAFLGFKPALLWTDALLLLLVVAVLLVESNR